MKGKSKLYQFLDENYVLDFSYQGNGNGKNYKDVPVNVYRAKIMSSFPDKFREWIRERYDFQYEDYGVNGRKWIFIGADFVFWYEGGVKVLPGETNIYISSVLDVKDYTEEQYFFCVTLHNLWRTMIFYAPWDSRNDTLEGCQYVYSYFCNHRKMFDLGERKIINNHLKKFGYG